MTPVRTRFFAPVRVRAVAVMALLGAAIAACDDPFKPKADTENSIQSFTVYALSGTPPNSPAALSFPGRSLVRVTGALEFDIAFDLDSAGRVVYLPVGLVAASPSGARPIGMQRVSGTFTELTEAPRTGYVFDSALVAPRGQLVAIQASESFCSLSLTPYIFAKVVVDSIDARNRSLSGHLLVNLNCGFRSLTPGLPGF